MTRHLRISALMIAAAFAVMICGAAVGHHPAPHRPVPIYVGGDGKPLVYVNSATCDGVTDNSAAIAGLVSTLQAVGGGTVQFGPSGGVCCVYTGVSVTGPWAIHFAGDSASNAVLAACNHDVTVLYLDAPLSIVQDMQIIGHGAPGDTTYGASGPTLHLGPNCGACDIGSAGPVRVFYGAPPILDEGTDSTIALTYASNSYATAAQCSGNICVDAGVHMAGGHNSFDTQLPANCWPALPVSVLPWAASTSYAACSLVTLPGHQMIQIVAPGASGSTAPAPQNYGINISDGSAVWRLTQAGALSSCIHLSDGSSETNIDDSDCSGIYATAGLLVTSAGGAAPTSIKVTNSTFGGALQSQIIVAAGYDFNLIGDNRIGGGQGINAAAVELGGTFAGPCKIEGNTIWGAWIDIYVGGANNCDITGNDIHGSSFAAVYFGPGVSNWGVIGNQMGDDPLYGHNAVGVYVSTGAHDFAFALNNVDGTTTPIVNLSTGANQVTGPNY